MKWTPLSLIILPCVSSLKPDSTQNIFIRSMLIIETTG